VKRFSVEDAVAAEEMLVTCLGKDVERRRAFIEEGALLARLDV
jgi:DNA gyrase/topoisomerase IV subunit B